jgi:hypothetical protein
MDFGVHEDVVRVQLHVLDRLGGIDHGALRQHGGVGNPRVDGSDGNRGGGTASVSSGHLLLSSQAEEQVSGGNEEDAVLGLNLNRDNFSTYCIIYANNPTRSVHSLL